jgi:hypothetical protein
MTVRGVLVLAVAGVLWIGLTAATFLAIDLYT